MRTTRLLALRLTLLPTLLLAACASAPPIIEARPDAVQPTGPVNDQLAWVLSALADPDTTLTEAEITDHFSPAFLEAVEPALLTVTMAQLSATGQRFDRFDGPPSEHAAVAVIESGEGRWSRLQINVDEEAPHLILGLLITPAPQLDPAWTPPESWARIALDFDELGHPFSIHAAQLDSGGCNTLFEHRGDEPFPVASAFKLFVLATLADAVAAGDMSWDDVIAIQDQLKSLPTGRLHNEAAGTELTLREYAELMISISDNTATDHLISHLGRERVHGMIEAVGHHDPSLMNPLYMTHELFALKLLTAPDDVADFLELDRDARQAYLDELEFDFGTAMFGAGFWTTPRRPELEWFASGEDMCNVMHRLSQQASEPAGHALRQILAINPGLALEGDRFSWVGFKGGSEPGVFSGTWLFGTPDDAWYVLSITLADWQNLIDQESAVEIITNATYLLTPPGDS